MWAPIIITLLFLLIVAWYVFHDLEPSEDVSDEPTQMCDAEQFGTQNYCHCGNRWDINDPHPPACRKRP